MGRSNAGILVAGGRHSRRRLTMPGAQCRERRGGRSGGLLVVCFGMEQPSSSINTGIVLTHQLTLWASKTSSVTPESPTIRFRYDCDDTLILR